MSKLFMGTSNSHTHDNDSGKALPIIQDYMQYHAQNNYCQANSNQELILDAKDS